MKAKNANDVLRERLRALPPPPPEAALRARVLRDAPGRADRSAPWWRPVWRPALAAAVVVLACVAGVREYLIWQEIQMLAELDTLSVATMLLM